MTTLNWVLLAERGPVTEFIGNALHPSSMLKCPIRRPVTDVGSTLVTSAALRRARQDWSIQDRSHNTNSNRKGNLSLPGVRDKHISFDSAPFIECAKRESQGHLAAAAGMVVLDLPCAEITTTSIGRVTRVNSRPN